MWNSTLQCKASLQAKVPMKRSRPARRNSIAAVLGGVVARGGGCPAVRKVRAQNGVRWGSE